MPLKNGWKSRPARERISKIVEILKAEHDDECGLRFQSPFELLIATILSAQCTDERVNKVTPALFKKYPTPQTMANAEIEDLEALVRSTGFFRQKSKSIQAVAEALHEQYNDEVPNDMVALTALPGIGRKTANVVLGTAYGEAAMPVDTHVKRLSNLLGLTKHSDPVKIEMDLLKLVDEDEQTGFSHRLIWHGRRVCFARRPNCPECALAPYCPSEKNGA
ncbi:MAG: endonuclease III [Candidatus Hinthialibacter antarcticus]|nr:endonuclease III [Candidatus Hinthialibacter antarcticus]